MSRKKQYEREKPWYEHQETMTPDVQCVLKVHYYRILVQSRLMYACTMGDRTLFYRAQRRNLNIFIRNHGYRYAVRGSAPP
jgi:hypothetical protein